MANDRLSIEAEPRSVVGKGVKKLRRDGQIPAVIYGRKDAENIQLPNNLLRRVLRVAGTTQLIDINVGGDTRTVLTREIQQHLTRGDLIHVDFLEVDMQGTVTSEATLVGVGRPADHLEGVGVPIMPLQMIQIEASPGDLVSEIEVDLSLITDVSSIVTVSDIAIPKGITLLTDEDTVVARFEITREEEEEEEDEMDMLDIAGSVEVIGEDDEEDDE